MPVDHIKMLCDISDLNSLLSEKTFTDCLQKAVEMVSSHMKADICSIYLYDEAYNVLTLKATKGLSTDSVNRIKLKPGEGIAGTALVEMRSIAEVNARTNPSFKSYPDSGEAGFDAYLAVPILRGRFKIGVLVVQRDSSRPFVEHDIMALQATASQLAAMLEHINLLMITDTASSKRHGASRSGTSSYRFVKAKSASEGIKFAPAVIKNGVRRHGPALFKGSGSRHTLEEFENAARSTESQLEDLQKKVEEKLSDAASLIFASHILMLKDEAFLGGMRRLIEGGTEPVKAVIAVFEKYKRIFSQSPNHLIREKVQDIEDLTVRLLDNLTQSETEETAYEGKIVIASELFPSDLLKLSAEGIAGAVLVSGGVTSHVGILARSLRLPLVIVDEPDLMNLPGDTPILLDADMGNIYLNPGVDILDRFSGRLKEKTGADSAIDIIPGSCFTADGTRVYIRLNINLLSDLSQLNIDDFDGVGLYRTEFPFMIRNGFPSEEEQFFIYKKLIDGLDGRPATIRTLDIGGDKVLSYYDLQKEDNPFLGMRSVRFSLAHIDIFKQQIRAILRAGHGSDLRIMFPMISSLDEYLRARNVVESCMDELSANSYQFNTSPKIGMMIEIPSLIGIIDEMAAETDFMSIGTNDLIQYTIAVDRTNEKVSDMYLPHHPSILRSIARISEACSRAGIEVSVCGDMANREKYIPFLLGVGISSLSMDAVYIPRIKKEVGTLSMKECARIAERLLSTGRISEIESILNGTV